MPQPEERLNCQLSPSQLLDALPFMSFVFIPCKPVLASLACFLLCFLTLANATYPERSGIGSIPTKAHAAALVLQGLTEIQNGFLDQARSCLDQALEAGPQSSLAVELLLDHVDHLGADGVDEQL